MKTCPLCYEQIEDAAEHCDNCGADIMPETASAHSAGKRLSCPWCLALCNYEMLYSEGRTYHCSNCTKAFVMRNGKVQRSDGTGFAAKALALLLFALFILPLIMFGCR